MLMTGYSHPTEGLSRPLAKHLREEIALLEARLSTLGLDGDCAYERALSGAYSRLLEERRSQLAALRAAGL
ncbi:hypothetical protein QVG61_10985 [Thiohalobacter sp. IOR34]|uniref:hypothetical protein n=1 Tax=Thiohalobacter sp. IOR34 TaxID=3057176 RepID=UPI0025AF0E94|nr:hypothetical protein [Thiohalobacter sp. IOR34]WJW75017.1 hypothetical protein QVG61_10985 [Thiohalobacter sp. IOR34]